MCSTMVCNTCLSFGLYAVHYAIRRTFLPIPSLAQRWLWFLGSRALERPAIPYRTRCGLVPSFFGKLKGLVLMVVRNFACWYLPRRYLLFVIDLIHLNSGKWDLMPSPIMSHPNHPHIIKLRNYDRNAGYDVRDGASAGHRRDGHGTAGYFTDKSCPVDLPCHSGSGGSIDLTTWFTFNCIEYIDICICMIIFSSCMFSIVKFVRRRMIYANVPRWCLHKHLLWLYGGLPMVIYFFVWLCMIGDCRCYHCWLVLQLLQNQWQAYNWYKPGKWCGDVTNVGLLSNSRLPYPCFRIVEGGLPLHEIYARSIHRWEWPKS